MKWRLAIPAVLIVVAFIVGTSLSNHFADSPFLLDRSTVYMETGLIALGMTFVIICGEIDLSVGSNMILTSCLTAKLFEKGWGIPAAVFAACVMGTSFGVFNGLLVAKWKLPSFLVTLGTMAAYKGAAQAMMGSNSVKLPAEFKGLDQALVFGIIPWPVVIYLMFAVLMGILLHQTVFGRWTYAVGTNESASRYSGVPVDRVKIAAFALTGLMCGIGALLIDSRLAIARYDLVTAAELDAITMVVVGGTVITGGSGGMFGTVLALVLIGLMKTSMGVANVKAEYQLMAIGSLLVLTVLVTNLAGTSRPWVKRVSGRTVS